MSHLITDCLSGSRVKTGLRAFFAVFSALCLILLFLPPDWWIYGKTLELESVIIVRAYNFFRWAAASLAIICIILAFSSLKFKTLPFRPALWLFPFLLYPASCAKCFISNPAPWTYYGTVTDMNKTVYYFLDSSFLQGQTMVIGRLKRRSLFLDRFDVLAETNGDSPRRYLHIVRPDKTQDSYGQLYLTRKNWLVAMRYDNKMYMAYDLNSGKPYVRDDVMALSPFIMIDPDTPLNNNDRRQILEIGAGEEVGQPRKETIVQALTNENPGVRDLAKKLLANFQPKTKVPVSKSTITGAGSGFDFRGLNRGK